MDVNKLTTEVVAVHKELTELHVYIKEDIEKMRNDTKDAVNDDVEKLQNDILQLSVTIKTLSDTVTKLTGGPLQYPNISALFETREQAIKSKHLFPIQTQDDLDDFEENLNEQNKQEIVSTVRFLIDNGGLSKNLTNILSVDIIMDYNLIGIHDKGNLNDYEKLMDVLYLATYKEGWSQKLFIEDLRKGLMKAKKKQYKNSSLQKCKERNTEPIHRSPPHKKPKPAIESVKIETNLKTEYVDVNSCDFSD